MMYSCGIDVAKRKHAVAILDERGQVYKPVFEIENTQAGMEFLLEVLQGLGESVMIGLEATGHYWLALYDALTRNGYAVVVINPMQIHAYRKSGIRKVKNDRTDAVWIADFVRIANIPASSRDIPTLTQGNLDLLARRGGGDRPGQLGRITARHRFSGGQSSRLRFAGG